MQTGPLTSVTMGPAESVPNHKVLVTQPGERAAGKLHIVRIHMNFDKAVWLCFLWRETSGNYSRAAQPWIFRSEVGLGNPPPHTPHPWTRAPKEWGLCRRHFCGCTHNAKRCKESSVGYRCICTAVGLPALPVSNWVDELMCWCVINIINALYLSFVSIPCWVNFLLLSKVLLIMELNADGSQWSKPLAP